MEDYVLVIAEKPDAARKIASALGPVLPGDGKGAFFEVPNAFDGNRYVVCSAVGHLYGILDPERLRSVYPVFDVDWFPKVATGESNFRFDEHLSRRLQIIARFALKASRFVNACDYDVEGETIGTNILQFACNNPGIVWRARFSTLVESDIRQAFGNLKIQENWLARAGKIRHEIDFLWGVNLSRALTRAATQSSNAYSNVSIGRVQGPALSFVIQRDIARQTHVPTPLWNIECTLRVKNLPLITRCTGNPIPTESEVNTIFESISKAESALVSSFKSFPSRIPPRYPFDLGELQREAFRFFHFSPTMTLKLAEKLYLSALISYPRTDSQKLPPSIQPLKILRNLAKNGEYSSLLESLFAERAMRKNPWQGPREDQAHPAIYPTGLVPRATLHSDMRKVFDLIVRRFCNNFAPDALIEKRRISFRIGTYEFIFEDENLIEEGWMKYYHFVKVHREVFGSSFVEGERLPIENVTRKIAYSKAPSRYNEGSLLAKMESEGLGTKATRADIISTLINRGYLSRSRLVPSENALSLFFELKNRSPEITSSDMTRELEKKLARIQDQGETEESILVESIYAIRNSLREIRAINQLAWRSSNMMARSKQRLGNCPSCLGGELFAIRSFRSKKRFIRCGNTECMISSPLPPRGMIRPTQSNCRTCGWPMITISHFKGKRSLATCSNYNCKSRKNAEVSI